MEHLLRAGLNVEDNPFESLFFMLRLGQTCHQLKRFEEAKFYLLQTYMYAGEELFEDEDVVIYLLFFLKHLLFFFVKMCFFKVFVVVLNLRYCPDSPVDAGDL